MLEKTDLDHYLTMSEIQDALEAYEVTSDRKTLYQDLSDLETFGIEVEKEKWKNIYRYHVVNRPFELAELKLLVDSIQSSKFITAKKSKELIDKLETLVSKQEASQLSRQVFVSGRIKTMNESIYYSVDAIHHAITENKRIRFQYFQWNVKKEMERRHNGAFYDVSPWGLAWEGENYYLVGYDSAAGKIKHYRVDKMLSISMSEEAREGRELFHRLDMAEYTKKSFGMFGGVEQKVRLLCENRMIGIIIDRFGTELMVIPVDEDHFAVHIDVHVSKPFLAWVISLGDGIRITGPDSVVEMMQEEIRRLTRLYLDEEKN